MSDKILSPSCGLFVEFQPAEDGTNRMNSQRKLVNVWAGSSKEV